MTQTQIYRPGGASETEEETFGLPSKLARPDIKEVQAAAARQRQRDKAIAETAKRREVAASKPRIRFCGC